MRVTWITRGKSNGGDKPGGVLGRREESTCKCTNNPERCLHQEQLYAFPDRGLQVLCWWSLENNARWSPENLLSTIRTNKVGQTGTNLKPHPPSLHTHHTPAKTVKPLTPPEAQRECNCTQGHPASKWQSPAWSSSKATFSQLQYYSVSQNSFSA